MSNNQEKMTKYLDFPFDTFLMLRFEYEVIFEDELVAKVLRIIENYIEQERKRLYREEVNKNGVPQEPLDITREIYVPISHKVFMSDLYGKVNSENTLKKAIRFLTNHRIVLQRHEPKKRYDAPEYCINYVPLQILLYLTRGYQNLIPSFFDTLKNLHPHFLTPSEGQELLPSEVDLSTIFNSRVSEIDTNFNNSNNNSNKHNLLRVSGDNAKRQNEKEKHLEEKIASLEALIEQLNTKLTALESPVPSQQNEATEPHVQEAHTNPPTQQETPKNAVQREIVLFPAGGKTPSASYSPNGTTNSQGKRGRRGNNVIDLNASEVATPEKPDPTTHPYNIALFMELADYYRGSVLPVNHRAGTKYMQAYEAAKTAVARKLAFQQVDEVFVLLKDRGAEIGKPYLKDPTWDFPADLWVVINNFDRKIKLVETLNRQHQATSSPKPSSNGSTSTTMDDLIMAVRMSAGEI